MRAFQYAWPPLAYSVSDDIEASTLYGLVTTYYVVVSGWVVAGLALLGRWVVRILAAPSFYESYRALPWVAWGWALYGLWVVFLVVAGRAKVTTRNFPAAVAGLVANVILLIVLLPPLGIAGAGVALCGAYAVMLVVMYMLTRRVFRVRFEQMCAGSAQPSWPSSVASRSPESFCCPTSGALGFVFSHRGVPGDPARALGDGVRTPGRDTAAPRPADSGDQGRARVEGVHMIPGGGWVGRPEVTVVMPFGGQADDVDPALQSLAELDSGPGDELILVDNSGVVSGAPGRR